MNLEISPAVQFLANKLANLEAMCALLVEKLQAAEQERDALKAESDHLKRPESDAA